MKKLIYIFFALFSMGIQAQTANGTETKQNAFRSMSPQTATTVNYLTTMGVDGTMGRITPVNVNIPYTPINYSAPTQTIGNHLSGIDTRLGQISSTSAGLTQRIYFTADNTVVNAVTYFASSALGKGSTATGSPPSLVLPDNTKSYFTKDVISIAQPSPTIGYAGTYSGNLTVSATPTPVATQQRFTLEVYRTDNLGVPIASGVSGAPVGDLGVTVVAILDSGIINLVAGAITNIPITGVLTQNITINSGERLRYHVSATKIGTGGGNVTFGVYYGSSYNSYYDVPVAITTDAVLNKSGVTGLTTSDALNTLNDAIPVNFTKVVYVDNNNPNSATIFDLNNPPTVNDNGLKSDVNNLYIGLDASTWVYNSSIYVTKNITSATSNFYLSGTTTDAGSSKTASIVRLGNINTTGRLTVGTSIPTETNIRVNRDISGATSSNSILVDGVVKSDVTTAAYLQKTIANTQASVFTVPHLYHNYASQGMFGAGSVVTNQYGFYVDVSFLGATNNYGFFGAVSSGGNRWNAYMNGTAPNYFNGSVSIGTTAQTGKLLVLTGVGNTVSVSGQPAASVVLGNLGTGLNEMPAVIGRTTNNTGLTMMASSEEVNTAPDMRLEIRRNDNTDFTDRTTVGWRFTRYGSSVIDILRNGTTLIGSTAIVGDEKLRVNGKIEAVAGTTSNQVVVKSQLDLKANLASPALTGTPTAPTAPAGTNTTQVATTAFVTGALPTSGTYTPTLTPILNVSSSSLIKASYTRIGNIINVMVNIFITPTTAAKTVIEITLPFNKATSAIYLVGSGNYYPSTSTYVAAGTVLTGSVSNVQLIFVPSTAINGSAVINFQYSILD